MIHVLIAEDEPPTLRRIAGMVEQLDPAFSVVATALNGKSALEKMETIHCDVVFTDIRMPVMDGMALMDQLRARYPGVIIVVLSGYQDFAYVSHAIRARSLDYLLKPVSMEAMRELLGRIKGQVQAASREKLRSSLALHLNRPASGMDKHAGSDPMGLCLFCAGAMPPSDDAEMYPAAAFWRDRSLERLAAELVPGFASFVWEFMGNTPVERILIFQTDNDQIEHWLQCLHEALLSGESIPVNCACLTGMIALDQTNGALKGLRRTLRDNIRLGRSLFLAYEPGKVAEAAPDRFAGDEEAMQKLAALLGSGRIGQPSPFKRELFGRIEREQWPQRRILTLFMGAAQLMAESDRPEVRETARQYDAALSDAVCTALSLEELENSVSALVAPNESEAGGDKNRGAEVAAAIEHYLRAHYAEHITNQTLATTFGYVPSYISVLFKQHHQLSPSDYLTQIRIEQAKALMQVHPDMLIREVAEQVGFKSQHHFSRVFKKNEGMWPTSYQS